MFFHPGIIRFPEIPLLEILDVWIGTGADAGRLLYRITQGIWSKRYVITSEYAYSLRDTAGSFPTLTPVQAGNPTPPTCNDALMWTAGSWKLYRGADGYWYLSDGRAGAAAFSGSRVYSVEWGSYGCTATPVSGWAEGEEPDPVEFEVDWRRWQSSKSWGNLSHIDLYVPATTHVSSPVTGDIQTGLPSWTNGDLGTVARTAYPTDSRGLYSYLFPDGSGFGPDVWNASIVEWEDRGNGRTYTAHVPVPGSPWDVEWHDEYGGSGEVAFTWNGYVEGGSDEPHDMCEFARFA